MLSNYIMRELRVVYNITRGTVKTMFEQSFKNIDNILWKDAGLIQGKSKPIAWRSGRKIIPIRN